MKKLTAYFFMTGMILVLLMGCKGKDKTVTNDPKAVVTAFFERLSKKDMDGAAKLATKDSKGTLDMMKKAIEAAEKMGIKDTASKDDPSEDFKNMVIGDVKIDGDNATVAVTNRAKGNETNQFPLKKEDGEWKVDFSMGTLMKMGMDEAGKMKNENHNGGDSSGVNDAIKDMMNADSLNKDADTTLHF
jgi:hypothetical protein